MPIDPLGMPLAAPPTLPGAGVEPPSETAPTLISDEEILELWKDIQHESIDPWAIFQQQWQRNIWYILDRQWIEYLSKYGGWRDKRMASSIPRPVTNKCKETVQAIRAVFTAIKLGVNVRPNGASPENVTAAATADDLAPILHETHDMNSNLNEFDFWLLACGNAFLHTFVDYDIKHGAITITSEQCQDCGTVLTSDQLAGAAPVCPDCQSTAFAPALDPSGQPIIEHRPKGKPVTLVLSPLEVAFPNTSTRFGDVPYIVRKRWRTKRYFESNPALLPLVADMKWSTSSSDQSLVLFQSLSQYNDMGLTGGYGAEGTGVKAEDGTTEYEVWMKPTAKYPEGLVFRIYGDGTPIVAHLEDTEALPGPLPYKDADGTPLFTFAHAAYESVGGRLLGSGPIDQIIGKQDQLNQLDSMILMIIQRMSNPVWLVAKGSAISKFSGMPGVVFNWNANTAVGAQGKPERIPGEGPNPALFQIREQYLKDIEELAGTFDIIKGAKPTGVEAFSALSLLDERAKSRFACVFQARGDAYKDWFKFAIELEREFGPDERTKAILSPARTWTFETFKRAQLQGSMSVVVEDGSTVPKTSLGMRAAIEGAAKLGMLNMAESDQQYEGLKLFGLTKMVPSLDVHVQAALLKQHLFEEWVKDPAAVQQWAMQAQQQQMAEQQQIQAAAADPMGMSAPLPAPKSLLSGTPLEWLPWFSPAIHRQEFLKWANSDKARELLQQNPAAKEIMTIHLEEIDQALMPLPVMGGPAAPPGIGGGAMAMANSNQESTQGNEPKGTGQGAQNAGPG